MREEKKQERSNSRRWARRLVNFIALSFILHMFFTSVLFRKQFYNPKTINQTNLPAQLRAPYSDFSLVTFADPINTKQTKKPLKTTNVLTTKAHQPQTTSIIKSQLPITKITHPAVIKAPQNKLNTTLSTSSMPQRKITQSQLAGNTITFPHASERMIGGIDGIRIRRKSNIDPKSRRNIIALSKGFIEKHEGEAGIDLIDQNGDPNKRPNFDELKYIMYETQILESIRISWNRHFKYRPLKNTSGINKKYPIVAQITFDEHGKLLRNNLYQSTGNQQLDTEFIQNIALTSPFAPIPIHFGVKIYTMFVPIILDVYQPSR